MKTWLVKVPIAGHANTVVDAETEEEAIALAIDTVHLTDVDEWEALRQFNQGNICYCPHPWEAEAEEE